MEWIPDEEYDKQNLEKQAIEAQIAELQAKLKNLKQEGLLYGV